jgi:NAD(P)-dependent dehydrogenase (short-subunit alcohol dehydrogenase family)
MRLEGRTALITGGTGKLGRAIAAAFAAEGAHVAVSGRDAERGAAVVAAIRSAGGRADFVAADLDGSPAAAQALAAAATDVLGGRIDVLVNNAGVFPGATTTTLTEADADTMLAVNVKAPFFLTAAVVPGMVARGDGVIVNLGSWVARLSVPIGGFYAATKAMLETLTRAWAAEFGPSGVRVNAISPGVIRNADETEHAAEAMMVSSPAGTSGTPDAIAHAAVYLASAEAAFVHGTVLDVDGGRSAVLVSAAT